MEWIRNSMPGRWALALLGTVLLGTGPTGCQVEPGEFSGGADEKPVVYGSDNRQDVYAYADQAWADRVAEFTVALMSPGDIDASDPDDVRFDAPTLQDLISLCPGERFGDQITPAWCSGTLIAPDLVLTAGHCVQNAGDCADTRFVFDFYMTDASTRATVTIGDVFSCAELVVQEYTAAVDYAIVRLDRDAIGRTPAAVRYSSDPVQDNADLVVSGFPSGLPAKIADGAWVRDNRAGTLDYFVANLDTFGGNSGSGVFLDQTGELAGILVRGETDYVWSGGCYVVNQCPDNGCRGEDSTYVFRAIDDFCATVGSGPLCACGDGTCDALIGENSVTCPADCGTVCGDGACNGAESPIDCPEDCGLCGNLVCEAEEAANGSCCIDCGCGGVLVCIDNACVPDPGAGDTCADPVVIPTTGTQVIPGDTSTAYDDLTGSCGSNNAPDRVYILILDETTVVDALVSGYDTVLYLRSTCDDPFTEIACNDDSNPPGNLGSRVTRELGPGTYYLIVDGYGSNSGSYELTVSFLSPPPNNTCDGAVDIPPVGTQVIDSSTSTAADDYRGGCGSNGGPDLVYAFTIATAHDVVAESVGFDTVLHARSTCDDPGSELVCNDDNNPPGNRGSHIDLFDLPPGTYYLFLDGYSSSSRGDFTLTVTFTDVQPCTDSDGDGVCDDDDGCPYDPDKTDPGVCGCGTPDTDTDSDGTADCIDGCPADPGKTDPGVCGCGVPDTDSDSDGSADCIDGCPADPGKTHPGICGCGTPDTDSDGDGSADCIDGCPQDPQKTNPGTCGCGTPDTDTDGDGTPDCVDNCPADPGKTDPGTCDCGTPDTDTDSDGSADCIDGCPVDPDKTDPGICGCNLDDLDSDGDGTADCYDNCAGDPDKTEPGWCGCGVPEDECDTLFASYGCGCSSSGRDGSGALLLFGLALLFAGITRSRWGSDSSHTILRSPSD